MVAYWLQEFPDCSGLSFRFAIVPICFLWGEHCAAIFVSFLCWLDRGGERSDGSVSKEPVPSSDVKSTIREGAFLFGEAISSMRWLPYEFFCLLFLLVFLLFLFNALAISLVFCS